MKPKFTTAMRIGEWSVDPALSRISRDEEVIRVELRAMRLLQCLAANAGQVVSIDDLLRQVWSGVVVTPDSVYQAVASLRRLLGDDSKQPTYIETVPRLGYRMIAKVESQIVNDSVSTDQASDRIVLEASRTRYRALTTGAFLILCGLFFYFLVASGSVDRGMSAVRSDTPVPKSIAVLPFLDLTDSMNEEPFADGMTEELIGKLSKVEGLRVPAPTSVFYFKGKQITVGEIAEALGVAYVLDGSVRKSGTTLRIAARLVRAEDGYVIWSETYDRTVDDRLKVQNDIAGEVARALKVSIQ